MAALTFDITAFAPMTSEFTRIGIGDNLKISPEPTPFRIAHASLKQGTVLSPLAIIVNKSNPLTQLTLDQITRIFAVGGPASDITHWNQLGLKGPFASQTIDPCGPPGTDYSAFDDPQVGEFLSLRKMNGLTLNHTYTPLPHYKDIVARVAHDPSAIGITTLNTVTPDVKVVALTARVPARPTPAQQTTSPPAAMRSTATSTFTCAPTPASTSTPSPASTCAWSSRRKASKSSQPAAPVSSHSTHAKPPTNSPACNLNSRNANAKDTPMTTNISFRSLRTPLVTTCAVVAFACALYAQEDDGPPLVPYKPHPVAAPPRTRPTCCRTKPSTFSPTTSSAPTSKRSTIIFTKTHPNIKIHLNPLGSEPAIAALTSDKSAFTPMGRDGIRQDLDGFTALHGYAPSVFLVGYDQSPDPDIFPPGKVPSAIWINSRNPLPKITVALAAQIFTTGAAGGDITHWSQLGVKGEWGKREIHVYLPAKRDSAFLFITATAWAAAHGPRASSGSTPPPT